MFTRDDLIKAAGAKLISGDCVSVPGVSTDTRTIRRGECFIALKGERFDGHGFLDEAVKRGASAVIVSSDIPPSFRGKETAVFKVEDTLKALGDIAHLHRMRFDIPVVAITGSNGKTTAKEIAAAILKKGWEPLKNSGTENNLVGLPQTLLRLTERHASAVLELGMNRKGEIRRLSEISMPNIGLITNIAPAHRGFFRDIESIFRAKRELFDILGKGDIAIVNNDDAYLGEVKHGRAKLVSFAVEGKADFRATRLRELPSGWEFWVNNKHRFRIDLIGRHNIYNALAGITIGSLFNISMKEMAGAVGDYETSGHRLEVKRAGGICVIDDTYNANPASLEAAMATLMSYGNRGKKILVVGDMRELGRWSSLFHREVGRLAARLGVNALVTVGTESEETFNAARDSGLSKSYRCRNNNEALHILKDIARAGDVVLVKGSRAMRMEDVVECFITYCTR